MHLAFVVIFTGGEIFSFYVVEIPSITFVVSRKYSGLARSKVRGSPTHTKWSNQKKETTHAPRFKNNFALIQQKKMEREKTTRWRCRLCGKYLKSKQALQYHQQTKVPCDRKCTICGHMADTAKGYKLHQTTHIEDQSADSQKMPREELERKYDSVRLQLYEMQLKLKDEEICALKAQQAETKKQPEMERNSAQVYVIDNNDDVVLAQDANITAADSIDNDDVVLAQDANITAADSIDFFKRGKKLPPSSGIW